MILFQHLHMPKVQPLYSIRRVYCGWYSVPECSVSLWSLPLDRIQHRALGPDSPAAETPGSERSWCVSFMVPRWNKVYVLIA